MSSWPPSLPFKTPAILVNGEGYWLRFGPGQNVPITGAPVTNDTITIRTGWNMIGSITNPVDRLPLFRSPGEFS